MAISEKKDRCQTCNFVAQQRHQAT